MVWFQRDTVFFESIVFVCFDFMPLGLGNAQQAFVLSVPLLVFLPLLSVSWDMANPPDPVYGAGRM